MSGACDNLAVIFDGNLKPYLPNKPIRKLDQFHKAEMIALNVKS